MNTEELEKSLRAEFEGYLARSLSAAREDIEDIKVNFEAELEKHRSQMNDVLRAVTARLDSAVELDRALSESVAEHLRLARDEGASITATAMGEAEKLHSVLPDEGYSKLRAAINDIRTKTTQAAILRSLVEAAANFAPRGAFFIVKNEHLVGWKAFGDVVVDDNEVRSVHFPVDSDTILSNAVRSLLPATGSAEGTDGNARFLEPLAFGAPESMVAIPLPARGRGVAVLYADGGFGNSRVNVDALETLVSVAGLTVELLAGGTAPAVEQTNPTPVEQVEAVEQVSDAEIQEPEYVGEVEVSEAQPDPVEQPIEAPAEELPVEEEVQVEELAVEDASAEEVPAKEVPAEEVPAVEPHELEPAFAETNFSEQPAPEPEQPAEEVIAAEPAIVEEPKVRFSQRTIDLPIEVSDEERRPHSDARRFARLLISEIRLYNEQKVAEGRETGDIYQVLKEAIDRSREMYDKRVQPDVASKFDYFHYELVNNLAEGDEEKLGAGYMMAVKV